jgi:energy-coupling factor transporter ATP-binding protein EcfA2
MTNIDRSSPPVSPYRGIHPFRYADQELFFGREEAISGLMVKVLLARLVVLFGESGAGKSSLINAGLVPALEKEGFHPERLLVRPDTVTPILIDRIQSGHDNNRGHLPSVFVPTETEGGAERVPCTLKQFGETIRKCVSPALTSPPIYPVLIFDQFEELFTLFDQGKQELQREILRAIFDIINDDSLKAKVVITIREDFVGKLEVLAKSYPRVFDHRVRLQPLDSENATKAIIDPFGKMKKIAIPLRRGLPPAWRKR